LLKKAIRDFFNVVVRKAWFSNDSHYQWLAVIDNGGTSCTASQAAEKLRFSTAC
jgi:hypothetical protein